MFVRIDKNGVFYFIHKVHEYENHRYRDVRKCNRISFGTGILRIFYSLNWLGNLWSVFQLGHQQLFLSPFCLRFWHSNSQGGSGEWIFVCASIRIWNRSSLLENRGHSTLIKWIILISNKLFSYEYYFIQQILSLFKDHIMIALCPLIVSYGWERNLLFMSTEIKSRKTYIAKLR